MMNMRMKSTYPPANPTNVLFCFPLGNDHFFIQEKHTMAFKKLKRFLSLATILVLCLSLMPLEAFASHIHSFADAWSFDTKGHWHACTDPDCPETDLTTHTSDGFAYAAHDFGTDKVCTVCGAEEESEVLLYSQSNARPATDAEKTRDHDQFSVYYHCEGTDIIADGSPLFDETGVTAGNTVYSLNITPKDSSVLISRIEALVSDYGEDYYKVGISGGVKQENAQTGVENGTTVHINGINAKSFTFGGGYGTVEFSRITVYFVRTTPPCEHSFTGDYINHGPNHARKCTKCGEYGPVEDHTFVKHECACGAKEVVEEKETLLFDDGSFSSGTYKNAGTNFELTSDTAEGNVYGVTVSGSKSLTIKAKDSSLKITRIEAAFNTGAYLFVEPSSGVKAEKGNVPNGSTVHINNIDASTFTLTGTAGVSASSFTDFTVYYTDGTLVHDFTGDYKDCENGKHQQKCTKCDAYGEAEDHTYVDGYCVCDAEDPSEFVINSKNELIKYNGKGGAVVLPEGIVAIADGVFKNNTAITSIEMPYYGTFEDENITAIGANAFAGCKNLTAIIPEIPFTVKQIGENAFDGCEKLTTVTIADIITHNARKPVLGFLGDAAFDSDYLKTVKYYCYLAQEDVEDMMSRYEGSTPFTYEQLPHQYEDGECVLCGKIQHIHSFTYQATDNVLTATCTSTKGDCELTDHKALLTITAPGGTYNGTTAFPATVSDSESATWAKEVGPVPTIKYYQGGSEIASAPVNAGEYTAKITAGSATAEITYTVARETPTYTVPTGLTAEYGKTLADVTLPTGFTWQDAGTTPVGNLGNNTFKVTYTPTDTTNYVTVTDLDVILAVTPQKLTKPNATVTSFVYTGDAQSITVTGYDDSTMAETGTLVATNVDNYSVTYSLKDKDNYTWADDSVADVTIDWSITQALAPTVVFPTTDTVTYDPAQTLAGISLNGGSTAYGSFAWKEPTTVPPAGSATYTVVFTPDALAAQNYGLTQTEDEVALTVEKATPVYITPDGLTAVYGQTLADVALPIGFDWQDDAATPVGNAGSNTFNVIFTPADTDNYALVTDIPVTVTVSPAEAPAVTFPMASKITYDPAVTLEDVSLNGGSAEYGTFAWKEPTTVPTADVAEYAVVFTPTDFYAQNYGLTSTEEKVALTVEKAAPEYTVPTGLTAEDGQTLADVTLPAGFAWQDDPATSVGAPGENAFKVTFTPTDTVNYAPARDIPVTVTVFKQKVTLSFNMNGHGSPIPTQTLESGSRAEKPTAPTETGWVFGGWYQDAELKTAFDFATALEANLELLAKWTQEELPPVDYKIIAGADSEWALDEEDPLSFRSDADYSKFVDVLVDDAVIAPANYTSESGSTIVRLKPAFLKTLKVGRHKLTIRSIDGKATCYFLIKEPIHPYPGTGDNTPILLWMTLLILSGMVIAGSAITGRKKKNHN